MTFADIIPPPTTQESKTPKTTLSDAGDDKPPLKHSSFCYSLKIPLLLFPQIIITEIIIIISPVTWNLLRFPHGIYYIISVVDWLEQLDNPKQKRCHRPHHNRCYTATAAFWKLQQPKQIRKRVQSSAHFCVYFQAKRNTMQQYFLFRINIETP